MTINRPEQAVPDDINSSNPEMADGHTTDPASQHIEEQDSTELNAETANMAVVNPSPTPSQGGMRSTSSKFASLRAAFEQDPKPDNAPNQAWRRPASSGRPAEENAEQKEAYEIEIARLKEELEQEKDSRIALEERMTELKDEIQDLSGALEQRDEQWQSEFDKRSADLMEEAEHRLNLVADEARSRQEEAAQAQKQLWDLKQSVAASTRASSQVSDTTFKQEFEVLQHEVQNWVVNHFRRIKVEATAEQLCERLETVADTTQLEYLKPMYEQYDPAAKIAILQATVASYLLEVFNEPYLYGLQGQTDWAKRSKQAADALKSVLDPEIYSRWRAMTFDALRRSESIKEPVESSANALAEMICIALQTLTDTDDIAGWQSSLKPIVQRAISFAHTIRVQHSTYTFFMPSPGEPFDSTTMEDVGEASGSGDHVVRCATFPAILKASDDDGRATEDLHVVLKAMIVCVETDPEGA